MLNLSLRLQRLSKDVILLRLPHTFRVFFGLLAVILVYGLFYGEGVAVVPIILLVISLFALFYDERWRFDRSTGVVEWRIGLMGLVRPGRIQMDSIDYFVLGELTKGRMPGAAPGDGGGDGDGNGAVGSALGANPGLLGGRGRMFQRRFVHLTLSTTDGEENDIERRQARSGENLNDIGREVAQFCERPLRES